MTIFATGPEMESSTFCSHDSHGIPDPDAWASTGIRSTNITATSANLLLCGVMEILSIEFQFSANNWRPMEFNIDGLIGLIHNNQAPPPRPTDRCEQH